MGGGVIPLKRRIVALLEQSGPLSCKAITERLNEDRRRVSNALQKLSLGEREVSIDQNKLWSILPPGQRHVEHYEGYRGLIRHYNDLLRKAGK